MKKKILITGASGFVGHHLVVAAKEQGLEVHAAVRETSTTDDIVSFIDKFVYLNLKDVDALRDVFEQ